MDGAAWIRQGLGWIVNSKFVLDKYHLEKYILKATGHVSKLRQKLKDAIYEADKTMLKDVYKESCQFPMKKQKKNPSRMREDICLTIGME